MRVLVVTGTDTGVGKTIATAALAVALVAAGRTVAVHKPVQAGTEDGEGDADVVRRLAGVASSEGIRLPDPMAPVAAAARSGVRLPPLATHADAVRDLAAVHDVVLVEGSGGLLVDLDGSGGTVADLAVALSAAAIVVCRSGLGTLNHTALTTEALARRDIAVAGLVIGAWPPRPTDIDRGNQDHFRALPTPLLGLVPDGSGQLGHDRFRDLAPQWLSPPPACDAPDERTAPSVR